MSDPEVLDVITHNRGSLSDTHTRATTQAQYILTDLDVAGSPRVKEALEAELASLPETPENAQRIQELNNALVTLDQRLSSPHSLSPTQVEEMMRAELSTLPNTPENVQRIRELNNGLITLDQRMRFIMGDALLWAEQVGTAPPKGAVDGKTTQTAWYLSQKSGTHLDAALQMDEAFEAGSSYQLHLANFYDLAARDLRRGVDPTETLEGLSNSIYLDNGGSARRPNGAGRYAWSIWRSDTGYGTDSRGAGRSDSSPGHGRSRAQRRRAPVGLLESEATLRGH